MTFFVCRGILSHFDKHKCHDYSTVSRQHDFRLHLGLQETVCKDNDTHFKTIQEIVKTVSVTDSGELTLVPYTNNWTVQFIRHKRRFSYVLGPEDIHMVTASQITELEVNHETCKAGDLQTISLKGCENIHWEVEVRVSSVHQLKFYCTSVDIMLLIYGWVMDMILVSHFEWEDMLTLQYTLLWHAWMVIVFYP